MFNGLEYILKLTDQFSAPFMKAAGVADSAAVRIQNDMNKMTGNTNAFKYSLNELKTKLDSINATRMSTHIPEVFRTATREAKKLEEQISRIENKGRSGGGFSLGGIIGTAAAIAGGSSVINTGMEQGRMSNAINFATNGAGNEAISQMRGINDKYGLSNEAGMVGIKTITGSTRGLGYTLKDQMDIYEGVGTGVAAMGLTADQAKLSFLALGQMASKGKVSSEELRQQLGEHIPGALGIAARSMGMTQEHFSAMLDKGEIMSKDFLPRFANQLKTEFGPAAAAMADGPAARLQRFQNSVLDLKMAFSEQLLPVFTNVIDKVKSGMQWFIDNKDVMVPLTMGIVALVATIKMVTFFTQAWTSVQKILNMTFWANPITWVIAAIIALIAVIGYVIYKTDGWGKQWDSIVKFFKYSWESFKDYFHLKWLQIQDGFMTGIEFMEKGWYRLKSLWDEEGAAAGLARINEQQNTRAAEIAKAKGVLDKDLAMAAESLKWELKWNDKSISSITGDLKKKFGISAINQNPTAPGGASPSGLNNTAKSTADSINGGGQRNITIHINKQVGAENIHVMNGVETANNIEALLREAMRRMLLSLNGNAVANA